MALSTFPIAGLFGDVVNRIIFTNAPTGDTYNITVGVGVLAATDCALAANASPRSWTLGQRRRVIKRAIVERSFFVPVEERDSEDEGPPIAETWVFILYYLNTYCLVCFSLS